MGKIDENVYFIFWNIDEKWYCFLNFINNNDLNNDVLKFISGDFNVFIYYRFILLDIFFDFSEFCFCI